MTLTINDAGIVVNISRESRAPSQQDFGTLLFLNPVLAVTARVTAYTSMAGVAADFDAADEPYKAAQAWFAQVPAPINFKVGQYIAANAIADELDLMVAADSGFYFVAPNEAQRDTSKITDIADWVDANSRYFVNTSNDALCKDAVDTTNIMYLLKTAGNLKVMSVYCSDADEYPCVAAAAIIATTSYRGNNTIKNLKFKDLVGIPSENLTANDLAGIRAHNGNVLYTVAALRMFDSGIGAIGTSAWIDEVVATDALTEEIRVRVFGRFARTSSRISYTESGMSILKAEVEGALLQYKENGFIADQIDDEGNLVPAFTVTSKRVYNASVNDKANRIAPDIEFVGHLAGAINKITVSGRLTLD